jgi:hypothetical protein
MTARTTTAIAAIAGSFTIAQAGPVLFDFEGINRGQNVNIAVGYGGGDEYEGRVFAGSIKHRVDDAMMNTYCIDPDQLAQGGVTNFERVILDHGLYKRNQASARANTLAELADIAGASIWTSGASTLSTAAFQVAAWEVVSDYDASQGAASFDFDDGYFRGWGNNSVFDAAATLLSQLTFSRTDASGYDAFIHSEHQDFMGVSVPAPGALALVAAGGVFAVNRRRREPTT